MGLRARQVLDRWSDAYSGEVMLSNLSIMSSQGDLIIETANFRMIYMESPNRTVVRTSLEHELQQALDEIDRAMVLDDLANA